MTNKTKEQYNAYDERNKLLGKFDTLDAALAAYPSQSFRNEANSYDVFNAQNKREKGTKWVVYNKYFYTRTTQIGVIKRPEIIN